MGRTKKASSTGRNTHSSPAVKAANSVKRKYGTKSPAKHTKVRRALLDVKAKKTSIRQAAKDSSVSVSYLRRRLYGDVALDSRNGPSPVFNRQEEETMARWLKEMAERGMGLKPGEFLDFVQSVVKKEKRKIPFVNDRPSYSWYQKFMDRNADIVQIRTETPLESSRAKLTRQSMDLWFSNFRDFLIEQCLLHKPQCIYNADETGFNMASKAGKVIGPARSNQNTQVPHVSGGASKQRLTVMFCGCADGTMIPPFLVFPEPKPRGYNVLTGGIVGSDVAFTKKGWMDAVTYETFLDFFDKHASKDRPVVLLVDSVSSHISMAAFENAKKNGILLYRIIPNATHLMQPLDKGVFGPLKQKWYQVARAHSREHPGVAIGKEIFSEKLKEAYLLFYKPMTIINSFRSSGIYPVDSTVITDSNLKPGLTYTHSDDEKEHAQTVKVTKSSQEQIEAQGALRAFETVLTTPKRHTYEQRLVEGFDIESHSPCFDVYKKLRAASEGRPLNTPPEAEPLASNREETTVDNSGLDILASAAIQQSDKEQQEICEDIAPVKSAEVSPVILQSVVLPKSAKMKKQQPKRLVHTLPHHLTSTESVRTMALRELSKIKSLAEKEKKAKKKFMAVSVSKCSKKNQKKTVVSKKKVGKTVLKETVKNTDVATSSEEDDEENATCLGCGGSWKEDKELGLDRTWVPSEETSAVVKTEIYINQSVIKGYHAFKIRPPMLDKPLLIVDREYGNIHDKCACLVWLPDLGSYPKELHEVETDKTRHLKLNDIAGLPIGHVPRGLGGCFREILDSNDSVFCKVTGEPQQSFPPWPAPNESGGGVIIPCAYVIITRNAKKTVCLLESTIEEMDEGSVMTVTVSQDGPSSSGSGS